jgi:hypothetical protein
MAIKSVEMMFPLLDEPGDGSGGGGAPNEPQGAPNDSAPTPAGSDSGKAPQSSTQVTAPAQKAEDDRYRGVLADLQKERRQRQDYERQVATYQGELAAEKRRVQALAGVSPQSKDEVDADAIRKQFGQYFPDLANLSKDDIDAIKELREQAAQMREASEQGYRRQGKQTLTAVVNAVTKEFGGTLSDRQARRVQLAFVNECESDPAFLARYDQGDETVIPEFVKTYVEDFFEPARRKVTQSEVERQRRVPSGRDRSVAGPGGKKIDYSNDKSFGDALVESYKSHGGAYGE